MYYNWIKQFYDAGMSGYDADGIKVFVQAGWITADQYKSITDIDYVASA